MVHIAHKTASGICTSKGSCDYEVATFTRVINSFDKSVQKDPDFLLATFAYAFNEPGHYKMWENIKPAMRDDVQVVGTLVAELGKYRGTAYASALLSTVSEPKLAKTSFQNKLIELCAYEVVHYVPEEKRKNVDWVLGVFRKVVPQSINEDQTHRILPYLDQATLKNPEVVSKLVDINPAIVVHFIDSSAYVDNPDILSKLAKAINRCWVDSYGHQCVNIPNEILAIPNVALALAEHGHAWTCYLFAPTIRPMWDLYAPSFPESITGNASLMLELVSASKGLAIKSAPDNLLMAKNTLGEMLAHVEDFKLFAFLKTPVSYTHLTLPTICSV